MDKMLTMRPACAGDAPLLCSWWNNGALMAHAGFPQGIGITEQEIILQMKHDKASHRLMLLENGNSVGEAVWRSRNGIAEIGIKICVPTALNRHLGTQYLQELLRMLFKEYGFEQVVLTTSVENNRARHVYEKLGFVQTATFSFQTWQMPHPCNALEYRLTKEAYMCLWGQVF